MTVSDLLEVCALSFKWFDNDQVELCLQFANLNLSESSLSGCPEIKIHLMSILHTHITLTCFEILLTAEKLITDMEEDLSDKNVKSLWNRFKNWCSGLFSGWF